MEYDFTMLFLKETKVRKSSLLKKSDSDLRTFIKTQ